MVLNGAFQPVVTAGGSTYSTNESYPGGNWTIQACPTASITPQCSNVITITQNNLYPCSRVRCLLQCDDQCGLQGTYYPVISSRTRVSQAGYRTSTRKSSFSGLRTSAL